MNISIEYPQSFLEPEIRCGFEVTESRKKLWLIELDLLNELKRVCRKYGLTYYGDSGTLIGAIRHQGYIPWDDDIDIVMMREDYEKLREIAPGEFAAPYFFQCVYTDDHFMRGYSRLRNTETTAIGRSDLYSGTNHGAFIDILCLDNVPDDEKERERWLKKIRRMNALFRCTRYHDLEEVKGLKGRIKQWGKYLVDKVASAVGYERIFRYYDRLCGRYNHTDTKYLSYITYSMGKAKHIWERKCFDETLNAPYEFTDICIPAGYDSRLRVEYGDYMQIIHANSAHGDLIFEPDIPFREYEALHSRKELWQQLNLPEETAAETKKSTEQQSFTVIEKPEWITYEQITDLLHAAHGTTAAKGMHFKALSQTPEETRQRLGEQGLFYVALTPENVLAGVGAVTFHEQGKKWYYGNQPYAEIKMVAVDPEYRGKGISNLLYEALERKGFETAGMIVMNTAAENTPVLERNLRHGWQYIDFCSWQSTDYYSVVMGKWKNCPYNKGIMKARYLTRKLSVIIMRDRKGRYRLHR